ncbi:outer membrane beta-barrel protein [Phenylobacterium montanum]|uniref:Outer membrane beta-barrel protein n=1 Tax=Phenylobacterium montanum TaxID=2823693 RepID=A0A975FX20_9CAUL|nr:outer membrane beta-barrel protein [Caulobacter sp. S6]QUD86512.1 outer membrane beta-barrel protein [Caulobacter sp. S6]
MTSRISVAVATLMATTALAGAARAQTAPITSLVQTVQIPALDIDIDNAYGRGRNVSVLERERPEYNALGEHIGGFTLYPKVEAALGFTDNATGLNNHAASDEFGIIKPQLDLQSNWSRHALELAAGGEFHQFVDKSSQNENGWYVRGNGHIDVYGDSYILIGGDAEQTYDDRLNAGASPNAAKPVPLQTEGAYVRGVWQLNRIRTTAAFEDRQYDYSNVPAQNIDTGVVSGTLINSDRNRNEWRFVGREEFALSPDTAIFAQASYSDDEYAHPLIVVPVGTAANPATETVNRNSTEYRGIVGANFDLAALVRGELGVGYVNRTYTPAGIHRYPTISGVMFEGKVEYFPSELTTVTLIASRQVEDAIYSISSGGYFANSVNLRVDHELLRNLLLNAGFGYAQDDYEGADRHDHVVSFQGGANYFVSRSVGLGVTVNYADRGASGAVFNSLANSAFNLNKPNFNVTTVMFSLVLQR